MNNRRIVDSAQSPLVWSASYVAELPKTIERSSSMAAVRMISSLTEKLRSETSRPLSTRA